MLRPSICVREACEGVWAVGVGSVGAHDHFGALRRSERDPHEPTTFKSLFRLGLGRGHVGRHPHGLEPRRRVGRGDMREMGGDAGGRWRHRPNSLGLVGGLGGVEEAVEGGHGGGGRRGGADGVRGAEERGRGAEGGRVGVTGRRKRQE